MIGRRVDTTSREADSAMQQVSTLSAHATDAIERAQRLESQLSWRTVTPEQTEKIQGFLAPLRLKSLQPFFGVKIGFSYLAGDAEAGEYAEELANALRKALEGFGAEISEPKSEMDMGWGAPPTGLFIQIRSRSDGAAPAAGWLQHALKNANIDAVGQEGNRDPEISIMFFVAPRPKPSSPPQ